MRAVTAMELEGERRQELLRREARLAVATVKRADGEVVRVRTAGPLLVANLVRALHM